MKNDLKYITDTTIQRYSDRYKKLGKHIHTLGWGSTEQQFYRFSQVHNAVTLNNKTLLDIGCGFADFLLSCEDLEQPIKHYTGWDVNPNFIAEAKLQYPKSTFEVLSLAECKKPRVIAEVGIMLGVLNLHFKEMYDNFEYSKMMIKKAFSSVSETLVVDFLSNRLTAEYPKEDFVFYHDPSVMLAYALELTPDVKLIHDYSPIPQKEFILVLRHV